MHLIVPSSLSNPQVTSPLLSFSARGYAPLPGVRDEMIAPDGSPPPSWATGTGWHAEAGVGAGESLDALLELADSTISYRQRYSITATRSCVVDLVALDPNNPRSIAFQASLLVEHLEALSEQLPADAPSQPLSQAILLDAQLKTAHASELDQQRLDGLNDALLRLSDSLART